MSREPGVRDTFPQRLSTHVWRFGAYEVDELRRELTMNGIRVEVEAKPWEVLHQLLLHAGEVVTKEELLESVWPGLTVVDGSLATAISKLRKALGDESIIITLPRIGYRLALPVQTKTTAAAKSLELQLSAGEPVPGREQWRLSRRLDHSPSSEVWLAEHPKTHEKRVFKFALGEQQLRGLKREVTLARLLRDSLGERREFVRIFEWNFERLPYFVESEYAGPNLAEWAEARGGLFQIKLAERLSWLTAVALAVSAAHDLSVLHKDLKPANILIAGNEGAELEIKIADFGSASLLTPDRLGAFGITNLGFTQTQQTGSLSGTLIYVAPEVVGGQSPTAASDVYALGVLLYQMVVGDFRKPLAPGWEADVTDPLLREDVADAACGDPVRRLQTAAEFADRLTNLDRRRAEREEMARAEERAQLFERRRAQARARVPWIMLTAVIALVAIVTAFVSFNRNPPAASSPAAARIKTVAVLPFQNISSNPDIDYLRLALPDEIATTLSHTRGLGVRPFASTQRYDQPEIDPLQAGREMNVSSVLTGHFLKEAAQLHITLEAVDVETNDVLWRDTMEVPADSMIATQVQIALRLQMGLVPALGATSTALMTKPKNEEAYNLFLRGMALAFDLKSIHEAILMLDKSVQLDPDYAPAWEALSVAYSREAHYTNGGRASLDRSDAANDRALALDPDFIDARITRVSNRVERGDLIRAYHEAEELVRRYPETSEALFILSYVLRFAGLLEESARQCNKAIGLDPEHPSLSLRSCAMVFLLQRDYPRASNFLSHYRDYYSGSDFATSLSIDMRLRQGKEQEALQLASAHTPQWAGYDLLSAYLQHKPAPEISALAEKIQASNDPETNYLTAGHLAYAGYPDAALRMLQSAIKGNYCSYPAMETDPMFTSLRGRPEFGDIRAAGVQCQQKFLAQR